MSKRIPVDLGVLVAAADFCLAHYPGPPHVTVEFLRKSKKDELGTSIVTAARDGALFAHLSEIKADGPSGVVQIHGMDMAKLGVRFNGRHSELVYVERMDKKDWAVKLDNVGLLNPDGTKHSEPGPLSLVVRGRVPKEPVPLRKELETLMHRAELARPEYRVGITGTRKGVSEKRIDKLFAFLERKGAVAKVTLHHGDCVGADAQAHDTAVSLGLRIAIHPPEDGKLRAHRNHWRVAPYNKPKPYMERNRDIVDQSDVLVALPDDPDNEEKRSGTWATVRYARKQGVKVVII